MSWLKDTCDRCGKPCYELEDDGAYCEKCYKKIQVALAKAHAEIITLKAVLHKLAEGQIALDVLGYISKLDDKDKIVVGRIAKDLGYKKEQVQKVVDEVTERRG